MTSGNSRCKPKSDFEPDSDDSNRDEFEGVLSKWTNYIHGWQDRYVCCKDGTIFYYRTQDETEYGCRGTISLSKALVTAHQYDDCRFDVSINDSTWYFRATDQNQRQQWIDAIELRRVEADNVSMSSESSGTTLRRSSEFEEKFSELRTLRRLLQRQVSSLQHHFEFKLRNKNELGQWARTDDAGSPVDSDSHLLTQQGSHDETGANLRGDVLTFKATADGIESVLADCMDMIAEREGMWRRKCEALEIKLKEATLSSGQSTSEDWSEDADSEDEFFDPNNNFESKISRHRFADEVEKKIAQHLNSSFKIPGVEGDDWEILAEEGEMKLFRRELIQDGVVCDPMKAIHNADGVTAHELCHYFWETTSRTEWDVTIEEFNVLERIDDVTVIIQQAHKQVWPIAQRDCVYISSILSVNDPPASTKPPHDTWMVSNYSVDHQKAAGVPGRIRAIVEVALVCQTHVTLPPNDGPLTRDCLKCDVVYIANVNPGGWAPASVLRAIGKREYPKFLRNFVKFVQDKTKDRDIMF